jgi:uncharacterized protein (DUF1800 family)
MNKQTLNSFFMMVVLVGACAVALGQTAQTRQHQRHKADTPQSNVGPALTDREIAYHVLNRMAFGPRPGQVDEVLAMGWENWARQQLEPDAISDDEVQATVAEHWPVLNMTMGDVFRAYTPELLPEDTELTYDQVNERQREFNAGQADVCRQVVESVLYRSIYSTRQFEQVIVEFWRNHFNIDQYKVDTGFLAANYEEQVIRKHAFGKFKYLLDATAHHPAMLIYLDNIVSQKPLNQYEERLLARYEGRQHKPRSVESLARHRGLNENYARELMELHTLGVDNGYSQRDVTEVSRALTGWSAGWTDGGRLIYFAAPAEGSFGFMFRKEVHDADPKQVLGRRLNRGGGVEEGRKIIAQLAKHPNTARFIAQKLCQYLVNDEPDPQLVQNVARIFRKTDGNLKKVYEAIIFSDQFLYRQNYRCKFKTPFEYVISSLRGTGAKLDSYGDTLNALSRMGQRVYGCLDPTGYSDQAEAWLDPGVLIYRWTYAVQLNHAGISGAEVPEELLGRFTALDGDKQMHEIIIAPLLPGGLDDRTEQALRTHIQDYGIIKDALAIVLGSPEFQQQ